MLILWPLEILMDNAAAALDQEGRLGDGFAWVARMTRAVADQAFFIWIGTGTVLSLVVTRFIERRWARIVAPPQP
jgi:hypothetical protein